MKFIAALIVGRRVLNVEGEPHSSIKLEHFLAVRPGEGPARINSRSIVTGDRREALLPMACRSHSLHVDEMREVAVLPSKLKSRHDVAYAPAINCSEAAEWPPERRFVINLRHRNGEGQPHIAAQELSFRHI